MEDKIKAVGGNYKLLGIKTFTSKENLYNNKKKYRKVFDLIETRYIYAEISFYNKLFDELDWQTEVRLTCTNKKTNTEVCELKKEVKVTKDKNIIRVCEGWGTPDPGWWKEGEYVWEVFIDNELVGQSLFYVTNVGVVNFALNPYFEIKGIRLFESQRGGQKKEDRQYLDTFNSKTTRYVNIEMELENKLKDKPEFPLELFFNFYNDAGQLKAHASHFKNYTDQPETIEFDSGYGTEAPGYWFEDKYTLEIIFMDQLIAVVPFEVGKEEVEAGEHMVFASFQNPHGIQGPAPQKMSFEEAKKELEGLIGLKVVKDQINELATYLQFLKIRREKGFEEDKQFNLHAVFTGNPGTGKTTVARLLGQIYHSLDLLEHGKVHEVGRADLVGEFIGQTAPKVKKAIEKARGGILFIDEAYSLTNRGDDGKDFGREVVEVLLKELSDGKKDISIIFAGYPKEMEQFLDVNPGMASRLRNIIFFPDYSPDELIEISDFSANNHGIKLSEEAKSFVYKKVVEEYRNRDNKFGNARFVNGIVEEAKQNMALRLMSNLSKVKEMDSESLSNVALPDVEKIFKDSSDNIVKLPIDEPLLEDALKQLNGLVGLDNIKREVTEMSKLVRYYREIGKDVKRSFSLHSVFRGNPGTGKTTIARLLVQIYKSLGILERGHIVETDRKDLVAGYTGQTAIKTGEMIDKAMGGCLFIDEAYSLTQGGHSDFGLEAVETLLKRMEDHRGEFMVIVAGYPVEMQRFLEANPGLMSRFDKQFDFKDYSLKELLKIAKIMLEYEEMYLNEDAEAHLSEYINKLYSNKHKYFGNARTVRKIVQEAIRHQNLRMADIPAAERTPDKIKTVTLEDISEFKLIEQHENERRTIGFGTGS